MPWQYSEKVLQLFKDAVRGSGGTHMGEIENPDGFGEHGSIICGDALRFFFRIKRHPTDPTRDVITQARYLTFGCTSAIAASEALCSLLEEHGKTPIEALKVTNQDLIDFLGGLPEEKIHCSVMGAEALQDDLRHVDLISFSGHKLHAPKGVGALFVRRGTRWRPFMIGGHQERGRRAGTENVPYIVGLAKACELAVTSVADEQTRVRSLRDRLQQALEEAIPAIEVNGRNAERLPNTLNLAIHGIEGEAILYELSRHGICASSGSACTSGSLDPSHVLKAMQVPFTAIHGSLRISLSRYNDEQDIERIIATLPGIVANLRRLSPYWDDQRNCLNV